MTTIPIITETKALTALCKRMKNAKYLTVDTEFIREKTYWPQLCLVQIASEEEAVLIDPLAKGLDLSPLFALLTNPDQIKVFHAARQDLEIFYQLMGRLPAPIFDTQIAAMVCGYGESIGYAKLVEDITGAHIDKSSRYVDWARRPLPQKQLDYALSDVTWLRDVYKHLKADLERHHRAAWLDEEMQSLTARENFDPDPEASWQRLKLRSYKPEILAMAQAIAAWREREAQQRDVPRGRVLRDEQIIEIAASPPQDATALGRVRGLSDGFARSASGKALLKIIAEARGQHLKVPRPPRRKPLTAEQDACLALLRVLLQYKGAAHRVAPRLIADKDDLMALATEDKPDIPALRGWRHKVFGKDARALKQGRLLLGLDGDGIRLIPDPAAHMEDAE